MADLDDGPDQLTLTDNEVNCAILDLLPNKHLDLVISHNPKGEYTRHSSCYSKQKAFFQEQARDLFIIDNVVDCYFNDNFAIHTAWRRFWIQSAKFFNIPTFIADCSNLHRRSRNYQNDFL